MIDIGKLKELLKSECIICNLYEKVGMKQRCKDCPFIFTSKPNKNKPSRIGLGHKFKKCGLTKEQITKFGKCHIFMFLYNPNLNFIPPTENGKTLSLHHINGKNYDDRSENLTWVNRSVHANIEKENNSRKKYIKTRCKNLGERIGINI